MQVDLDIHELYYLLDNCLRGSHLRSGTVERFVDQWYELMSERQRMNLFEWAVRLTYAWSGHKCFEPSSSCCGKDVIFMKRYHPKNQYRVTAVYNGKENVLNTFIMDTKYYINSTMFVSPDCIVDVENIDASKWEEYKQPGIDYDKNILD